MTNLLSRKAPFGPGKQFNGQLGAAAELLLNRLVMARWIKSNPFMRAMAKKQLRKAKRK